mmetsp:Transcript_24474/g.45618  ORF Transcript_24474/g.45618 Transcript_24474/m.45618 type:complete len:214 (+) Transcript_24474:363-1004(+)
MLPDTYIGRVNRKVVESNIRSDGYSAASFGSACEDVQQARFPRTRWTHDRCSLLFWDFSPNIFQQLSIWFIFAFAFQNHIDVSPKKGLSFTQSKWIITHCQHGTLSSGIPTGPSSRRHGGGRLLVQQYWTSFHIFAGVFIHVFLGLLLLGLFFLLFLFRLSILVIFDRSGVLLALFLFHGFLLFHWFWFLLLFFLVHYFFLCVFHPLHIQILF